MRSRRRRRRRQITYILVSVGLGFFLIQVRFCKTGFAQPERTSSLSAIGFKVPHPYVLFKGESRR